MQVFGGAGVSQDTFLAEAYAYARFMRMGDGPDQVHLSALGKALIKRHGSAPSAANADAAPRPASTESLFPRPVSAEAEGAHGSDAARMSVVSTPPLDLPRHCRLAGSAAARRSMGCAGPSASSAATPTRSGG